MNMRHPFLTLLLLLCLVPEARPVNPAAPAPQQRILVLSDRLTSARCRAALTMWTEAMGKEGLSVTLKAVSTKDPARLRSLVTAFHRRNPNMEGLVLVGDFPLVAVVADGDTVVSDRYWDHPEVAFAKPLRREATADIPRTHYLTASPVSFQPEGQAPYYVARIPLPPCGDPSEAYTLLSRYLEKAARARGPRLLDHVTAFTSFSEGDDGLSSWLQEDNLLREAFPEAFRGNDGTRARHGNYRMGGDMKTALINDWRRTEGKLFILRGGGTSAWVPLCDTLAAEDSRTAMRLMRSRLYATVRAAACPEETKKELEKTYDLLPSFWQWMGCDSVARADSLVRAKGIISAKEVMQGRTCPLLAVLSTPASGQFFRKESLALSFLFNGGATLTVWGSTAVPSSAPEDVIRPLMPLARGARIGQAAQQGTSDFWGRILLGDPTPHFLSRER